MRANGKKEITVVVDEERLKKAQEVFSILEIDLSEAVDLFLEACTVYGDLPFKRELEFSERVLEAMEEARAIAADPNAVGYDNVEDLIAALEE